MIYKLLKLKARQYSLNSEVQFVKKRENKNYLEEITNCITLTIMKTLKSNEEEREKTYKSESKNLYSFYRGGRQKNKYWVPSKSIQART